MLFVGLYPRNIPFSRQTSIPLPMSYIETFTRKQEYSKLLCTIRRTLNERGQKEAQLRLLVYKTTVFPPLQQWNVDLTKKNWNFTTQDWEASF